MMMFVLVSLTLAACVSDAGDPAPADESQVESNSEPSVKEKWCNSYPQSHCPTNVCVWDGARCTLPSLQTELTAQPEEPSATEPSTKEKWCNSYPQSHCPTNVCAWQPTPAPGKCTLRATE